VCVGCQNIYYNVLYILLDATVLYILLNHIVFKVLHPTHPVAVCCSVLQCVAVCCSVLLLLNHIEFKVLHPTHPVQQANRCVQGVRIYLIMSDIFYWMLMSYIFYWIIMYVYFLTLHISLNGKQVCVGCRQTGVHRVPEYPIYSIGCYCTFILRCVCRVSEYRL